MTSAANQGSGSGLDALARKSLETLLKRANRHAAGISGRAPALTSKDLSEYHALREAVSTCIETTDMDYTRLDGDQ